MTILFGEKDIKNGDKALLKTWETLAEKTKKTGQIMANLRRSKSG